MRTSSRVKPGVPKLLFSTDVAKLMGWSTTRARRWLIYTGAGVKRGGRVVTTPGRLGESFPELLMILADEDQ